MALETYPSWMEKPLLATNLEPIDPVVRTAMEIGDKARRQYTATRYQVTFPIKAMDGTRLKYLLSWWEHKINAGADWFEIDVRMGDAVNTEEVRLTRPPQFQPIGVNQFSVTLTGEMRTSTVPSESAVDSYAATQ